jgi:hypothetical protein
LNVALMMFGELQAVAKVMFGELQAVTARPTLTIVQAFPVSAVMKVVAKRSRRVKACHGRRGFVRRAAGGHALTEVAFPVSALKESLRKRKSSPKSSRMVRRQSATCTAAAAQSKLSSPCEAAW